MMTTAFKKPGTGRLLTGFAVPDAVTGSHGYTLFHRDGTSAGARDSGAFRSFEAAAVRSVRAGSGFMRRLREGPARRRTVRELRLMGRSRLADLGIDPDAIEDVADAMLAARRGRMRGIASVDEVAD